MKVLLWLKLFLSISWAVVGCQNAASSTQPLGAVTGIVIGDDGYKVRMVEVALFPQKMLLVDQESANADQSIPSPVQTDVRGQFYFHDVEPGTYVPYVTSAGYLRNISLLPSLLAQSTEQDRSKLLSELETVSVRGGATSRIDLVAHRGASLRGRVTCDDGGILSGLRVIAELISTPLLREQSTGGTHRLDFKVAVNTDDLGEYRISGLPEGVYRISVHISEKSSGIGDRVAETVGNAEITVYYPNAVDEPNSKAVSLSQSDDAHDIDIDVPFSKLHSVAGTISRNGMPCKGARVNILEANNKLALREWHWGALTTSEGQYRFDLLPSGSYRIQAFCGDLRSAINQQQQGERLISLIESDVLDANIDIAISKSK